MNTETREYKIRIREFNGEKDANLCRMDGQAGDLLDNENTTFILKAIMEKNSRDKIV